MAFRIVRIFASLAPEVCPMCEGGSGLTQDANRPLLRRCPACAGTGNFSEGSLEDLQHRLDGARRVAHRTPTSEQPRAA